MVRSKYIVLDIVFEGSSLNYDEGAGNYQELKKVTLSDGRTYTMVSRYALRYSMVQTMKRLFGNNVEVPGEKLSKEQGGQGQKNVFQPDKNLLTNGEILLYPELDLFGFLITEEKESGIARESPVKVTHAVSLTPYEGDSHFAGNHSLARRAFEAGKTEKFEPNIFIVEEHQTLYKYTIVIDVDEIGKFVFYTTSESDIGKNIEEGKRNGVTVKKEKISTVTSSKGRKKEEKDIYRITIELDDTLKEEHLRMLLTTIFNLTREIKGRPNDLSPKFVAVSVWDKSYSTLYNHIGVVQEYEEVFEEEERKEGNKVVVVRRISTRTVPKLVLPKDIRSTGPELLNKEELISKILSGDLEEGTFYLYTNGLEVTFR